MTRLRLLRIVGLSAGLVALGSCRVNTQPVMKVDRAIYKNHGQLDLDTIRQKIVAGLDDKGWGVVDEADGWLVAEVRDDDEWARVRITYDEDHYSIIHFESSPDFMWNGSTIHRRYNSWVENLDEAITEQFDPEPEDDDDDDDDDAPQQIAAEPAAASAVAVEPTPAPQAAPAPEAAPPPADPTPAEPPPAEPVGSAPPPDAPPG
jgi:hypothetical protein